MASSSLRARLPAPASRCSRLLHTSPVLFDSEARQGWRLTPETMNQRVRKVQYAVRGELVIRAEKLQKALADSSQKDKLPFKEVIYCNIGNPQELQQRPITFFRQVLALSEYTDLHKHPLVNQIFPEDAIARSKLILSHISGGLGAYSNSKGAEIIRKHVAQFIEARDGCPSDPESIYLTEGASAAVMRIFSTLIKDKTDGILVPIPQYPLYSASIPLYGGTQLNYYLDEDNNWSLKVSELDAAVEAAKKSGVEARAVVIINPGNPTGQCLDEENMREIVDFCHRRNLVLLADEVYQVNSYVKPWRSFKKVVHQMGSRYADLQLVSFHSVSKGVIGECGKRGGYMELQGFDENLKHEIYKLASISLCPNLPGQLVVDLMVKPPVAGEASYELYKKETDAIFASLKRRAQLLVNALNRLEGVTCNSAEGAMYLLPRIRLPAAAVQEAAKQGRVPDVFYCIKLLEETGICTVPGSGFGQKDGTFHFRTTFLPPESKIETVVRDMTAFHKRFMEKYS